MKNFEKYISLLVCGLLLAVSSCKYDTYVKQLPVNVTTPVSYDTIVQPIFNASCAISGCHVTGAQAPDLTPANSYSDLYLYGIVDTANPQQSVLYLHLIGSGGYTQMPPAGALSPLQIGQVLAWITQGGQNN
jgi:mono/diheme cytochrome c family protein